MTVSAITILSLFQSICHLLNRVAIWRLLSLGLSVYSVSFVYYNWFSVGPNIHLYHPSQRSHYYNWCLGLLQNSLFLITIPLGSFLVSISAFTLLQLASLAGLSYKYHLSQPSHYLQNAILFITVFKFVSNR